MADTGSTQTMRSFCQQVLVITARVSGCRLASRSTCRHKGLHCRRSVIHEEWSFSSMMLVSATPAAISPSCMINTTVAVLAVV